jgi:hypothetical protein
MTSAHVGVTATRYRQFMSPDLQLVEDDDVLLTDEETAD